VKRRRENINYAKLSLIDRLKKEKLIDERFLVRISNLTLEDIIAIKLELACQKTNGKLYGLNLARAASKIIRESLITFANSVTKSRVDAAMFLGLDIYTYDSFHNTIYKGGATVSTENKE
jgi:hypothetical protein